MSIGGYRPGTTLAHRLDPRAKLVFTALYLVAAFVSRGWALLAVATVAATVLAASGTGARKALGSLRPFAWLMAFVLVFDSLFSTGGVSYAVESVVRFALVLLGSSTLMATTSPTELTDGCAMLLRPLAALGVDVDAAALAIGMTLRFVPVVMGEYRCVREAQEARGADFSSGGTLRRARSQVTTMVPLLASALRRSETLALAIRNRGFGEVEPGTRGCIRSYELRARDCAAMAVGAALVVLAVVL
ncbi:energy-coupling factor transporter transmembrane component T family protein [Paratractidigestivibacter faecalis]|uniref:Energy-coupling factor transporter transmembrane component T n=1 Tax=Paratractidigestivibacter faecalis TaxID=2292441 RepID=A0ABV1IFI1_9ACTN